MKQYLLKAAGAYALLAMLTAPAYSQEGNGELSTTPGKDRKSDDVIIIRPKTKTDTKLTIEINGDDVKINDKPLSEFKNDNVNITRQQHSWEYNTESDDARALTAPRNRFRGGNVYSYSGPADVQIASGNKAFLGVGTEKTNDAEGVKITSITDESAAEKAGLKEGDIITKINDTKITTPAELTRTIGRFKPEEKITVTYLRDKKEQKATATLTKRKGQSVFTYNAPDYNIFKDYDFNDHDNFSLSWTGKPRLGVKAQDTEDGKGLKVLEVDDESPAEKAGLKEGDIIFNFDGKDVNSIETLRELSAPAIEKGNFTIKVNRDGKSQDLQVKIPKKLKTTNL